MKASYQRFVEVNSFAIRGPVADKEWELLKFGFTHIAKDLEKPLLINLLNAEMPPPLLNDVVAFKKTINEGAPQKILFVSKEKEISDYIKLEQFFQQNQSTPMRQIIDRLILEDANYELEKETEKIEEQLKAMGFDKTSSKLEIQKNIVAKAQKKALDAMLKWQKQRKLNFRAVPCEIEGLEANLQTSTEEITRLLEQPIDL